MLHGITYADETDTHEMQERFWQPVMKNGYIRFCRPEECPIVRTIRPQQPKQFTVGKNVSLCDDLYAEVMEK